jgi:hypothetical protein
MDDERILYTARQGFICLVVGFLLGCLVPLWEIWGLWPVFTAVYVSVLGLIFSYWGYSDYDQNGRRRGVDRYSMDDV